MENKKAREIYLACLVGDGSLSRDRSSYHYHIGHGESQKDYLEWKRDLLKSTKMFKSPLALKSKVIKLGDKEFIQWYIGETSKSFRIHFSWSRHNDKKSVRKILKYMTTPLSLAIWFMDDGSVFKRKKKHKDGSIYYLRPSMKLCTHSFDKHDHQLIIQWLKDNFDVEGYIVMERKRNRPGAPEYYTLNFNCENTQKIWELIKPYVTCPSMKDKFAFLIEYYQ